MGNFMNSEIVGKPTGDEGGVVFAHWLENSLESFGQGNLIANADATTYENTTPEGMSHPIAVDIEFKPGYSLEQVKQIMDNQVMPYLQRSVTIGKFFIVDENQNFTQQISLKNGKVTGFLVADGLPRYPTQLYEAATYFLIFILLFAIWFKLKERTPEGLLLGLFLISVFGMRFVWEFWKANQEQFEEGLPINMGQILSIPLIVAGIALLFYSLSRKNQSKAKVSA
jgi:prolipoprotein diacylglyceryltransferase